MTPDDARCPFCGSERLTFGYGFAGGGLGSWTACLDCSRIIAKERSDEAGCFRPPILPPPGPDDGETE